MQSTRLKNIIILILALTDLFLLASLGIRLHARCDTDRRAMEELTALFAADRVALDPDVIPDRSAPDGFVLVQDQKEDRRLAETLLGPQLTRFDRGGGIVGYAGAFGSAIFRPSGSFDATGPFMDSQDPEAFCRRVCKKFHYADPVFSLENGSGTVTATQRFERLPVMNARITFTITDGAISAISGTHLPETYSGPLTSPDGQPPISALTALTAFLDARRQSGAVVSAVQEVYPCYALQSSAAAPMVLTPAWCIATDTRLYYVNGFTGSVSHT